MDVSGDITAILRAWEFDPDNQVRIIRAEDGREVLQVRQPLGIEQYELDGRPDGAAPEGMESLLDVFRRKLEEYQAAHGSDAGFAIDREDFKLLQSEGMLYYYRYLVLFQIGQFDRTARDTEHNLQLAEMVDQYAESDEDKREILQYRPYIVRMHAVSKAMLSLHRQLKTVAREILESAIDEIEKMPDVDTPAFQFERVRSLNYLRSTLKQVVSQKESPLDRLRNQLETALEEENYERAAELRDRIKALGEEHEP